MARYIATVPQKNNHFFQKSHKKHLLGWAPTRNLSCIEMLHATNVTYQWHYVRFYCQLLKSISYEWLLTNRVL